MQNVFSQRRIVWAVACVRSIHSQLRTLRAFFFAHGRRSWQGLCAIPTRFQIGGTAPRRRSLRKREPAPIPAHTQGTGHQRADCQQPAVFEA